MAEINNNDKIYEAYMGKLGFKFQKETQMPLFLGRFVHHQRQKQPR